MTIDNWRIWDKDKKYGDLFFKRATGTEPEMESSKAVSELLKPFYKPGMSILDVGCGVGHYLKSLRDRLDPQVNYTGVDPTENYLDLARKAFGNPEQFVKGDIFNLPFKDSSFDIVMCNNVFMHLPPPPTKPLLELLRVAKNRVVIRTDFGERNYIIRELRTDLGITSEADLITENGELPASSFFNIYTETYFRELLGRIAPDVKVEIIPDTFWKDFDVRKQIANPTATHIVGGKQVTGNIILDFRFIILEKKS